MTEETLTTQEKYKWFNRPCVQVTSKQIKAHIIEDYVANERHITDLSRDYGLKRDKIYEIICMYYKKPEYTLTLASRV